jgi:purine-cytosine permease-like protein
MFNKASKGPFIIWGVVIATAIAVAGVGAHFIPLLNLFGTFIPPLGGVIIGDYFFTYKKNIPMLDYVKFRKLRIAPLIAYLIGCAAAYFEGFMRSAFLHCRELSSLCCDSCRKRNSEGSEDKRYA